MRSLLNPENPAMRFLTRIGYSICLNCLWFLCSLPVITAGASTTALYAVMQKVVRDEESSIFTAFFRAFKENFGQATRAFLVLLPAGLVLGFDGWLLWHLRQTRVFWTLLTAVWIVLFSAYCIVLLYIFPLMARFRNTTFAMIKSSLLTGMHYLFCTVLIAGFHFAVGYVIIFLYTPVMFLGEGLCALFSAWVMKGIILHLEELARGEEAVSDGSVPS
jgi:uncharacterized membrane protein YesL